MEYLIDSHSFNKAQLLEFCNKVRQSNKPAWRKAIFSFIEDYLSDKHYIEVQTSGTTGKPKKINILKNKMKISAAKTAAYFQFKKGQNTLLALPAIYIAAKMMIVRAFENGLNLICVEPGSNFLQNIEAEIYFCPLVPMQAQKALSKKKSLKKIQQVKHILLGGAPIGRVLLSLIQQQPNRYYHSYGMTETLSHIAIRTLNQPYSEYFSVLSNIAVEKDERDCLIVDAPEFSNEPIITNDIVELKNKKTFKWLGRYDNIINSGGVKIIPEQVEAQIEHLIENQFYVTGEPDEFFGQKVVLYIESENTINTGKLLKEIEGCVAKYRVPKKIEIMKAFERTASGKVIKQKSAKIK